VDEYHKIPTVFKRDPETKFKTLLWGKFATPELHYLAESTWMFTEKIDGTNIRVIIGSDRTVFYGKTGNAQIPPFLRSKLEELFPLGKLHDTFPDEKEIVCLYGEGYGAKIQSGGGYTPDGCGFILFDVKVGKWWLKREDVEEIAHKLGILAVPIISYGTLQEAVDMAQFPTPSRIGNRDREGLVMRPEVDLLDRAGNRIIAKIKFKDFAKKT